MYFHISQVRWRFYWWCESLKRLENKRKKSSSPTSVTETNEFNFELEQPEKNEGLKTGLQRKNTTKQPPQASPEVETFLHEVETMLLEKVHHTKEPILFGLDRKLRDLSKKLKDDSRVIIPTDKTNSFIPVELNNYIRRVDEHMSKRACEVSHTKLSKTTKRRRKLATIRQG